VRGRKPTPTHLKLIAGNPGKRAINHNEPKPDSKEPPMPPDLDADEKAAWRYVTGELERMGILASSDLGIITAYCTHWGTYTRAKRAFQGDGSQDVVTTLTGAQKKNPHLQIMEAALRALERTSSELGLTPTARTRIHIEKQDTRPMVEKLGLR